MTTIVLVRKNNEVVVAGDGQVSMGNTVVKSTASKVRKIEKRGVVAGFAGSTADALTLFERLESKLEKHSNNLMRSCVELAKDWRTDRYLRRLEAMMLVADKEVSLILSGTGDVLEPKDGLMAIGSGGNFALAAARAMFDSKLKPEEIAKKSLEIAAELCIYTNNNIIVEIWNLLLNHGKKYDLCPVGLGARDTLRIEMGYCLYGNEINDDITPHEANLMWITDMNKDFVGKKSLEKSIENSKKKLVGFKMIDRGIPRKDYHVFDSNNNLIGKVTSGTFSPSNKLGVGMALIDFKNFKSNEIFIEQRNKRIKGLIQKLPI